MKKIYAFLVYHKVYLFRLKMNQKENRLIKDKIIRNIRNFFGLEKEDYYKPVEVGNFWSRNYTE